MQKTMLKYGWIVVMMLGAIPVNAQFWGAKQARPIDTPKDSLKKGEFTWAPELAPQGPILVTVSLDEQRAYTYRNGVLIGVATTSTGKKGHETPTGVFHTILKDAKHRSSKYNNASMPYTQKFTQYGVALHAGGLPGYPSSHGCVHLPSEYARLLFNQAPTGMVVVVTNKNKSPEFVNHPAFLSPVSGDGKLQPHERLTSTEDYRWTPEKATEGPLSILVSRTDQRMVVLRNGKEIGRAKVAFSQPADSVGTHLFIVHQVTQGNALSTAVLSNNIKWLTQTLSDNNYGTALQKQPVNQLNQIKIPENFTKELLPYIAEGTTLMVTDAAILRKTTGKEMAVLSSSPDKK